MSIAQALAGIGVPVCHPPYLGAARRYVTCQLTGQSGILYAEGREAETAVRYMVSLYGERDAVFALLREVKPALEAAGYIVTVDTEFYDNEARLHRIVLDAVREGSEYA